jgi:DNA-binding NarL/FixJ family response regulator
MATRALIVDDHPIIRDALVTALVSLSVFDEVVTVRCFRELREKLEQDTDYQLMILDLSLTDISGPDGMIYIREHYADIPILVFSSNDSTDVIAQCFEYGVHGFVSKNSPMQIFVNAIRMVLAGSIYIPPEAASLMGFEPRDTRDSALDPIAERIHFTPKQRAVFEQLMLGVPNKIIARRLDLAEGTVKAHLHGIYQLLRVNSRATAVLRAQQLQLFK